VGCRPTVSRAGLGLVAGVRHAPVIALVPRQTRGQARELGRCGRFGQKDGSVALLRLGLPAGAPEQCGEPQSRLVGFHLHSVRAGLRCQWPDSGRALGQATLAGSRRPAARGRVRLQQRTPLYLASVWFSQQ